MNGTQPNLLSAQLELDIKLYQAAIKEDASLAADRTKLSIGLSRQPASPPLWALASFLGREDPDQSNENFLLRLTEAIWAYSVQNPAGSARLYDNIVKDVIYQHWASGGQQPFSLSCIHVTNALADWHLIVSKAQDKESRWKIMNSAAMVQSSTGDHKDDEKSKKLWLEERFLT